MHNVAEFSKILVVAPKFEALSEEFPIHNMQPQNHLLTSWNILDDERMEKWQWLFTPAGEEDRAEVLTYRQLPLNALSDV